MNIVHTVKGDLRMICDRCIHKKVCKTEYDIHNCADFFELVRCKDCKYGEYREDYDDYECEASGCGLVNNADFYCADGEGKKQMPKYINADQFERDCMFDRECDDMQDVIYKLRDYPAADVRENIHGKWATICDGLDMVDYHICSLCGHNTYEHYPNFCPNCGADMRGETE